MDNTQLATASAQKITIGGLEDLPPSIIPIPYVRLVQPTSKNIETSPGVDALPGTFLFDDTKTSVDSLAFILLRAKHGQVQFERDGEMIITQKIALLCLTGDRKKLFLLSISPTSFSNFGHLVAQLKEKNIQSSWHVVLSATSQKQENEKGKYYVVNFLIEDDVLSEEHQHECAELATAYGMVLEKKQDEQ